MHNLIQLLERMLENNIDISYRKVAELSNEFKHASSITRDTERKNLVDSYKFRQEKLRLLIRKKTPEYNVQQKNQSLLLQIDELKNNNLELIASHNTLLKIVGELGGFTAWSQLCESLDHYDQRVIISKNHPEYLAFIKNLQTIRNQMQLSQIELSVILGKDENFVENIESFELLLPITGVIIVANFLLTQQFENYRNFKPILE
ncbi:MULTISPECIES: hypothetical protein [unclassified Acinetobacter]|uniref:hypothetical protein n=1 Tax=unclassified Acinetobacter TaxID=196816 RepID=UPI0015D25660|nr:MULTISPECIES: hypothetical protein [unclassified Acinetobacter]UUS62233.1 hypothetical protein MST17_08065 [Acinetobacter sp. YH16056_T]